MYRVTIFVMKRLHVQTCSFQLPGHQKMTEISTALCCYQIHTSYQIIASRPGVLCEIIESPTIMVTKRLYIYTFVLYIMYVPYRVIKLTIHMYVLLINLRGDHIGDKETSQRQVTPSHYNYDVPIYIHLIFYIVTIITVTGCMLTSMHPARSPLW